MTVRSWSRGSAIAKHMALPLLIAVAACAGGCHDFDALRARGDGAVPNDGNAGDSGDAASDATNTNDAPTCPALFVPTGWSKAEAAAVSPCGDEVVFRAQPRANYVILTGIAGGAPGRVVRLKFEKLLTELKSIAADEEFPDIQVSTITVGGVEAAAIIGSSITIESGVKILATGVPASTQDGRPLVFISSSDIDIVGTLDVGSELILPGPGSAGTSALIGAAASSGTTLGGAGGGNATVGGKSGTLAGGDVLDPDVPVFARGGRGGDGRRQNISVEWARGGTGGGAVQLLALGEIRVRSTGVVSAGGGGGSTRSPEAGNPGGGGGGGAGGSIFLEAPSVRIAGAVGAPGGGAGTVGCAFNDQNCVSAESERGLATRPGGAHGAVHAGGCNGGNGSDRDGVAESRTGVESGCGGGGGAGFVRIRTSAGGLDLTGASFHPDDRNASENPGKLVQLRDDLELPK